jgi:hypothetical protein
MFISIHIKEYTECGNLIDTLVFFEYVTSVAGKLGIAGEWR